MGDPFLVSGGHRVGHRDADREHSLEGHATSRQHLGQGTPLHQLHGQQGSGAVVLDGVDGHDVGVVERSDGERLTPESLAAIGIGGRNLGQHLQGDIPLEPRVAGPVHLAHSAFAQRVNDFVGAETGASREHSQVESNPFAGLCPCLTPGSGLIRTKDPARFGRSRGIAWLSGARAQAVDRSSRQSRRGARAARSNTTCSACAGRSGHRQSRVSRRCHRQGR